VSEVSLDIGVKEAALAGYQLPQSPLGLAECSDVGGDVVVDLGDGAPECVLRCRLEVANPGQWHSGLGQRADLDQLDSVLGGVAPVAGAIPSGLGEKFLLVIDGDGLRRHADKPGELSDGDHNPIVALDLALGAMPEDVRHDGFHPLSLSPAGTCRRRQREGFGPTGRSRGRTR